MRILGDGRGAGDVRHRTFRATIQWSYDLLGEPERRLFRHLAVFPDGFDLTTAERVAADLGDNVDPATALAHLVDASVVDALIQGRPMSAAIGCVRSTASRAPSRSPWRARTSACT